MRPLIAAGVVGHALPVAVVSAEQVDEYLVVAGVVVVAASAGAVAQPLSVGGDAGKVLVAPVAVGVGHLGCVGTSVGEVGEIHALNVRAQSTRALTLTGAAEDMVDPAARRGRGRFAAVAEEEDLILLVEVEDDGGPDGREEAVVAGKAIAVKVAESDQELAVGCNAARVEFLTGDLGEVAFLEQHFFAAGLRVKERVAAALDDEEPGAIVHPERSAAAVEELLVFTLVRTHDVHRAIGGLIGDPGPVGRPSGMLGSVLRQPDDTAPISLGEVYLVAALLARGGPDQPPVGGQRIT